MSSSVETYYVKRGRRYVPVKYRDISLVADSFPEGYHLIRVKGNSRQTRQSVDPDRAGLVAAMMECQDLMVEDLVRASEARPDRNVHITEQLREDWQAMIDRHGDQLRWLSYTDAWSIADHAIQGVAQRVAGSAWQRAAVQSAWQQFVLTVALSGDGE